MKKQHGFNGPGTNFVGHRLVKCKLPIYGGFNNGLLFVIKCSISKIDTSQIKSIDQFTMKYTTKEAKKNPKTSKKRI